MLSLAIKLTWSVLGIQGYCGLPYYSMALPIWIQGHSIRNNRWTAIELNASISFEIFFTHCLCNVPVDKSSPTASPVSKVHVRATFRIVYPPPPTIIIGILNDLMYSTHEAWPRIDKLKQPNLSPANESPPNCNTMAPGRNHSMILEIICCIMLWRDTLSQIMPNLRVGTHFYMFRHRYHLVVEHLPHSLCLYLVQYPFKRVLV